MDKQKTIKDVAELAGVSVATASRVLSDSGYPVRPHLRQRVKEAAEKLEYAPNVIAQSLRRDTSRDIALIVPNLSNPFYLQAVLGVGEAISATDHNVIFCNTMHDPQREQNFLRQLYERQIKGVILSSVDTDADTIGKYVRMGMRFVFLDQHVEGVQCPGINYDSRAGARMAVEHLLALGHRKIAFATTSLVRFTRNEIFRGYQDALLAAGIPYNPSLLFERAISKIGRGSDYELNIGRQIAREFLEQNSPATAIFCVNDMVAIGLIQTLVQNGIQVPEQVSVVGFDDIPIAEAFLPALTTVHCPAQEIGRLAGIMLLDSMNSEESQTELNVRLTPRLMLRSSTASPLNAD